MESTMTIIIAVTGDDIGETCQEQTINSLKSDIERAARDFMEQYRIVYDPMSCDSYEPKISNISMLID